MGDIVCAASLLAHVEQAEAWQAVVYQQLFLHKLPLHLTQLHGAHAAAIRGQFARCVLLECDEELFRSCGGQCVKKLFFEDGEGALQRL